MAANDLFGTVADATRDSDLIRFRTRLHAARPEGSVLFDAGELRPLNSGEIEALEANRNTSDDWGAIRVSSGFDPERIRNSRFIGRVVLGAFRGVIEIERGVTVPSGVYRSLVSNCEIGDEALVYDVRVLGGMIVDRGAVVFNCGSVLCSGGTSFGNGVDLPIAIETGGREVKTYAEITVAVAAEVACCREDADKIARYERLVENYVNQVASEYGYIGRGARVANTLRVEDVFVGNHCRIEDAVAVKNATLLGTEAEPAEITSGAFVRDSIVQWGSEVSTGALIDRSVLTEHAHVGRHGKVTDSLIGPNTGVAEGEITASLVGPFVGFHHQALLIAAFWPEGKGNVGYGANVGSNHTSKAPDQEIWPGEGTFFGLGVNIKFPSDFTEAPYSIFATAVDTLPQKLSFPFSLINAAAEVVPDLSPAYNEIMPAWVLSDNLFTVRRNEGKYRKRNRARRSEFEFEVFRTEIMDLVAKARDALGAVEEKKAFYTGRDIPGLGKNYLKEQTRLRAIETYTLHLKNYALTGLKRELATRIEAGGKVSPEALMAGDTADPRWEHERRILAAEGHGRDLIADLEEFIAIQEQLARSVEASKEKDDQRGTGIIPDYGSAHPPAGEDDFVMQTWAEYEALKTEVESLISALKQAASS